MPRLPAPPPGVSRARARVAGLRRHRPADDPDIVVAEGDLAAEKLASHVRRVVGNFPPLTTAQRDLITALLTTASGEVSRPDVS